MRRCFQLARKGQGAVSPNPNVGCVIVYKDRIIAEGYHKQYGGLHAEREALAKVSDRSILKEATVYVNLEPCNHHGKTPPCTDALLAAEVAHVVISNTDPNPLVAGKGIKRLQTHGVRVTQGVLENEGWDVNQCFFTFHKKKRPYIILKWAESLDGFIDKNRTQPLEKPVKISGTKAQWYNHYWRSTTDAVVVGAKTAQFDNPNLLPRYIHSKRTPIRVIADRSGIIPNHALLDEGNTLIYQAIKAAPQAITLNRETFLQSMLNDLYNRNIQSLYVEGGSQLHHAFFSQNLWDEMRFFRSKNVQLVTGVKALSTDTLQLNGTDLGSDMLYYVKNKVN